MFDRFPCCVQPRRRGVETRAQARRPDHGGVMIRVVVGGVCATRTGGRSKQRPYHERITVHGPTA